MYEAGGVPKLLVRRAALPMTRRCANTGWSTLGQAGTPEASQAVWSTLTIRERMSTPVPVEVSVNSRLRARAMACVPESEKSVPSAYMCATSRVTWVAPRVRPRRMPSPATPSSTGTDTATTRAISTIELPARRRHGAGVLARRGTAKRAALHNVRRSHRELQRSLVAQERNHPGPGQVVGRDHHDVAAGIAPRTRYQRQRDRVIVRDRDCAHAVMIGAERIGQTE